MSGYANQVVTLRFDELSDDPQNDPLWVAIRNPKLQPIDAIDPGPVELGPDGKPANPEAAVNAMYDTIARLVLAWRVYDATALDVDIDPNGNPVVAPPRLLDQVSRSFPATPDMVRRLPMEVVNRLGQEIGAAVNPQ